MLDFGLIDYLNIDFSDLFKELAYEDDDINEIIFSSCVENMFACAHLSTLTGGYLCEKAEKSDSIDEAVDYYHEALNLVHSDFEWSDVAIRSFQANKDGINLQILKRSYDYCLDSISSSINRRLNGSEEENKAKKSLVDMLEEIRTGINSAFEK